MTKRLAVIDGKSVFYRGYYAMPGLSTKDGTPTGGVFGFASLAIELIKKLEPDFVAVAWDKPKTNIRKRRELYPEYKAGRKPAPPDFYEQVPILHRLLDAFGWPLYEIDDYEADDIMGAFAVQATKKGIETCLLTSDLDVLQLVGPLTHVYAMKSGLANIELYNPETFEEKYGLDVEQFLDLKALKGDSSDNIPGVPGIGEKGAIQLLQEFKTLDNIYEHLADVKPTLAKKLEAGKESAYLSKEVARIWTDIPIELDWDEADVNDCDLQKVADILKELEFHSLIKRLPKNMQQTQDTSLYFHEADEVNLTEIEWPDQVTIDGPFVLHLADDELWASFTPTTISHTKLENVDKSFWRAVEFGTVISYDIKALYHALADKGIEVRFSDLHDIRQAAYLLDPLRRDRSLAGLIGGELASPVEEAAAMRQIYGWQCEAFKEKPKVDDIAKRFDFPLIYHLFKMEHQGIILDTKILKKMSKELGEKHAKLEQEMYTIAGQEFNIGSPAQLSEILFTKLQLPTAGIKKGKTGYSTGQKELDKLRGLNPIIELIEQTRELSKLKNTYVDTLPLLVDEESRLHTTFNQDVAPTGRLSSVNPNLQNIPVRSEAGKKIREAFVPAKGNVFVSADYSQFELRLAAVLADDKELIEDFNGDLDIHTKTASDVYGIPLDKVTKNQRRDAKVINFGVLYGMSPHGLSAATGMDFVAAKKFIDQYFELRKPIREFIDKTLRQASEEGYVETFHGRRRPTPDVNSSNFMVREAGKRAAANMPIQGTEADLMKLAMIKVDEEMGDLGVQVLQIHDSILVECPEKNAEKVGKILKDTMEAVAPELPIKLKVDVSVGKNWGEV
ncbi:MAG TPA: DNA polymerase I [Candidatus Saccharibacteria bacterium]|nr:DNA polymerase I [Candidatus Saccharibacteria bacterium]HRK94078.1 DNA polymerase I [Candidatus Saccharibacteria bacterium]